MESIFKYNREKMLTAVLYILDQVSFPSWQEIHKTFYVADKKSIVDFGKPISGNTYVRMTYGPVPSELGYLLVALRQHGAHTTYFGKQVTDLLEVTGKAGLQSLAKPDLTYLSRTDIECLDHAIEVCNGLNFSERTALTHDFAWSNAKKNGVALRWEDIAIAGGGGEDCVVYLKELEEAAINAFPPA